VEVILLVDALGSPKLTALAPLTQAGARVQIFNPPFSWKRRRPILQRDHRKILVVDDVGFCGGMNISEDYAGHRRGNALFRDSHALLEGPCVHDLARIFAATVQSTTRRRLALPARAAPMDGGVLVQVLESDVPRKKRHIQRALYQTLGHAEKSCFLTTPYFCPPHRMLKALMHAARRGVDVRVLTAGMSDVPIVAIGARHLYGNLLNAGVRIFEMKKRTLHAKTVTIDGVYASVGSFNLDRWSFERNLECNFAAIAPDLAAQLERCFATDVELGDEVKPEQWVVRSLWVRLIGWLAYQLMRL
jgi:cardiolipin synthase